MISSQSRTKEWVMGVRETSPGRDPILIEKMSMALTLVENLRLGGLNFIFKGGTSLILLLGTPQRFSILGLTNLYPHRSRAGLFGGFW